MNEVVLIIVVVILILIWVALMVFMRIVFPVAAITALFKNLKRK